MKLHKILIVTILAAISCTRVAPEEITQMNLSRCLMPTHLSAELENDADVIFGWQVNKDAESFKLVYADNGDFENSVETMLEPSQVPFRITLGRSTEYYFKVQALSPGKEPSKWAVYESYIRTR